MKNTQIMNCLTLVGSRRAELLTSQYTGRVSYGAGCVVGSWISMSRMVAPAETVFVLENTYAAPCTGAGTSLNAYYLSDWDALCGAGGAFNSDNRATALGLHNGFTNVGFMDGHAKTMNWKEMTCANYTNENSPADGAYQQQCTIANLIAQGKRDLWTLNKATTGTDFGGCSP